MSEERMCACGKPLHYSNPDIQRMVKEMIQRYGEEIRITEIRVATSSGRSWMVPRHYIALHGLKAQDLPELGFPEVTDAAL